MSGFRINSNVTAMRSNMFLQGTNNRFTKSMDRLSSGRRIVSAGDDAAGLAIANRFRAETRALRVAERNIAEATSLIGIAEGSAQNVEQIAERLFELATQASSANAQGQLDALDQEFQAQLAEIDRIAEATQYSGVNLVDGTFSGVFQVGYANEAYFQIDVDLTDVDVSVDGLGLTGIDLTSQANAQAAMDAVSDAIDSVNSHLGDLGAWQNRLDSALESVQTTTVNFVSAESVIRDVDMASEISNFASSQVLQQVGAAMLANANASGQTVLALL